ncbi:carboxylate--amine ligase [Enterococcus olivae]
MESISSLVPILLGSDMNVYGMARAFHEAYGICCDAYASQQLAPTKYSKIVRVQLVENFQNEIIFINTLKQLKETIYTDASKTYLLIPCGDVYVKLVSKFKAELENDYTFNCNNLKLFNTLSDKATFYEICEQYGLPYPKTQIVSMNKIDIEEIINSLDSYPVVLKPANSILWLSTKFEGKKKAFIIKTKQELHSILQKIKYSNYSEKMIIQDYIIGDDSYMRVVNIYVDKGGRVQLISMGQPLLEDPSPEAIGNYMAILPDYDEALFLQIKQFLTSIHYKGFPNLDLKYDEKENNFKVFEINLRQGRSSYYSTLNGYNLAKVLTEDLFYNFKDEKLIGSDDQLPTKMWLAIPKRLMTKYVPDSPSKNYALELIKEGNYGSTVFYKKDFSIRRWVLMAYMYSLYRKTYKKYFEIK